MAGCGCGGRRTPSPQARTVIGYDYVPPGGGAPQRLTSKADVEKAERRNGGGTSTPVYR